MVSWQWRTFPLPQGDITQRGHISHLCKIKGLPAVLCPRTSSKLLDWLLLIESQSANQSRGHYRSCWVDMKISFGNHWAWKVSRKTGGGKKKPTPNVICDYPWLGSWLQIISRGWFGEAGNHLITLTTERQIGGWKGHLNRIASRVEMTIGWLVNSWKSFATW